MAAPSNEVERTTRCRALVGGLGVPGLRDLDFGRSFVSYSEGLDWPEDVVVEEIPSSALLVLHRLQELRPDKLIIVVAVSRWPDQPGTVRRYHFIDQPAEVHDHGADALTNGFDLRHSLALARQWGALPETVVVEVEPAETTLGLGFSEEVGAGLDRILALIRDELAGDRCAGDHLDLEGSLAGNDHDNAQQLLQAVEGQDRADDLAHDWDAPSESGQLLAWRGSSVRFGRLPNVDGLMLSARFHPGDPERRRGGDWCDTVPVGDGWTHVVIGEAIGHGLDSMAVISELRTATRACSRPDGPHPRQTLAHLDRAMGAARVGETATALCLAIHPATAQVRIANAGHCPALLCAPDGPATLCAQGLSASLGASPEGGRSEATFSFPLDTTLLLFTSGLLETPHRPIREHLSHLASVAGNGPRDLEALCDHVFATAQAALPPGEGGRLLAIRREG